jgi:uncharacterized protein
MHPRWILAIVFLAFWVFSEVYLFRLLRHWPSPKYVVLFTCLWFGLPVLLLGIAMLRSLLPGTAPLWAGNLLFILMASKVFAFFLVGSINLFYVLGGTGVVGMDLQASRREFLRQTFAVAAALPFFTLVYGVLQTASDFQLVRKRLRLPGFPRKLGLLKVVQISDIHTGSVLQKDTLQKMVDSVMKEQPDLILFTGDLVNNTSAEVLPFASILAGLSAPMGVHSVLGNHDYGDYYRWPDAESKQANLQAMYDIQAQMGWNLLLNSHIKLAEFGGESLYLAGVENWGARLNFKRYGDLGKALKNIPDEACVLLMSHDPSHWEAQILQRKRVALTMSGHTHGFQFGVEIPGFRWSPSQYVYKQWAGLYSQDKQHLYVNRGTGCIGYSGRVGIRPEITVFELSGLDA